MAIFTTSLGITDIFDGVDAYTVYLTNESEVVAAGTTGVVATGTTITGNIKVLYGISDVTDAATYSIATATGSLAGQISITSAGAYTVNVAGSVLEKTNSITIRSTHLGTSFDRVLSITRSDASADGTPARTIRLSATRQTFFFGNSANGTESTDAAITLTANLQNVDAAVPITWAFVNDKGNTPSVDPENSNAATNPTVVGVSGSATATVNAKAFGYNVNRTTLGAAGTSTDFTAQPNDAVIFIRVTATVVTATGTLSDTITISKIRQGDEVTFSTSLDGTTTVIKTTGNSPDVDLVQGSTGNDGINTAPVYAYKRTTTAPLATDKPTSNSNYIFATTVLSAVTSAGIVTSTPTDLGNGWFTVAPSATSDLTNLLYRVATVATTDPLATATSPASANVLATAWSAPEAVGSDGKDGNNTAVVYAYKRATGTETTLLSTDRPTTTTTWTFAGGTASPSSLGNSWFTVVPAGTTNLFVCVAIASGTGTTDSIPAGDVLGILTGWGAPQLLSQNGTDGTNGAKGDTGDAGQNGVGTAGARSIKFAVWLQSAASGPGTQPSATGYNFTSGALSGLTSGWGLAQPTVVASQTLFVWAAQVSVVETTFGGTPTITIGTPFQFTVFSGLIVTGGAAGDINAGSTTISGGKITADTLHLGTGGQIGGSVATAGRAAHATPSSAATGSRFSVGATGFTFTDTLVNYGNLYTQTFSAESSTTAPVVLVKSTAVGDSNSSAFKGISSTGANGFIAKGDGYSFYAEGTRKASTTGGSAGYGPFTGAHDVLAKIAVTFVEGDIMVDVKTVGRNGLSNTISEVAYSTSASQKGSVGVAVRNIGKLNGSIPAAMVKYTGDVRGGTTEYETVKDLYNRWAVNAVGEGQINIVGEGGNLAVGDLIVCSSTKGKGMKQKDDIVYGYTVAKVREAVTFTTATEEKQVACIYLCG